MFKRKLGIVFGIMLFFSIVSAFLITVYGRKPAKVKEDSKWIVTSFYPVYIITENLAEGIEGVQVVNLTENHTGCLHDYQLTTKDMLVLEQADILVINGGGMELFAVSAASNLQQLQIIDSSAGILLLDGSGHTHTEDEDEGKNRFHTEDEEKNGHIWMDLERYCKQVHNIAEVLCRIDSEHAESYQRNAQNYLEKLSVLKEEYETVLAGLAGTKVILFHDAFYYICDELGLDAIHGIDMDADTTLSAGEIAEISDEINLHGVRFLLAEEATSAAAVQIAAENGCQVIYLDPLTSGDITPDAYLNGMRRNMDILKEIGGL